MKFLNVLLISVFILLLTSCGNLTPLKVNPTNQITSLKGCPDAEIEWLDRLMIDDIKYEHHFPEPANENLSITIEKGRELGKVAYRMAGSACSNHKMQNGDATFLKEGTSIYEVKGYPTSLIVTADDVVYVADTNINAKTAGELYPIEQLVKNIYIESTEDGRRLHTFSQSSKEKFVAALYDLKLVNVQSLLNAGKLDGNPIFLEIELNNGVSFRLVYWIDSNTFNFGAIGNEGIYEVINDELSNLRVETK